jgi:SAM-dependent methyltransferase
MKIDYTRYYRHWHDESETHRAEMSRYFAAFLGPWLPASKSARILDVGCGMGFALHALRDLGYTNVSGIDMDAGQVEAARRQNLAVEQCDDSIAYLNARPEAFDLILCLDVIEHVPVNLQLPFAAALGNALEKTSGRLICTVPNANSSLAARWRYGDWTHTTSFTEHSLDFLLFNAGFRDIRILPGEVARKFPARPSFPAIASWLAWRFFRTMRRLELMAELGTKPGRAIPLSINLLAVASR